MCTPSSMPEQKGMILVVEDNSAIRKLLAILLRAMGWYAVSIYWSESTSLYI
jgi:CheY-like chemotaxis protein